AASLGASDGVQIQGASVDQGGHLQPGAPDPAMASGGAWSFDLPSGSAALVTIGAPAAPAEPDAGAPDATPAVDAQTPEAPAAADAARPSGPRPGAGGAPGGQARDSAAAGGEETSAEPAADAGCACRLASPRRPGAGTLAAALAALGLWLRRRRRRW